MKKLISLVLCLAILMSLPVCLAADEDSIEKEWYPSYTTIDALEKTSDVIARFAVGSDVHINYSASAKKFRNAYSVLGKLGGVDAFILAGDLTDMGQDYEYEKLMSIIAENSKELTVDVNGFTMKGAGSSAPVTTTIIAAGNHEYYAHEDNLDLGVKKFSEYTGQALDKLYWLNGKVPVIKLGMKNTSEEGNYYDRHDFIKESLDAIDASGWDGHIFLISHTVLGDTVKGSVSSAKDGFTDETEALLKKYPQIIHVTGHSHFNPFNIDFIDQSEGITCMNDGIVGKSFDDGFNEGADIGSTGILFDVMKDGTTKFYRVDFQNGRILFEHENWVLDSSDKPEDFIYFADPSEATRSDAYNLKTSAPYFTGNEEIVLRDLGNYDSVEVTFPKVKTKTNNNYDLVYAYTVEVIAKDGKAPTRSFYIPNTDHLPGGYGSDTITTVVNGLSWNTDYYVEITAESVYGHKSETIRSSSCVNVGERPIDYDAKLLYDVDYSYGTTFDFMGDDSDVMSFIKLNYDESIGRYAANFIGLGTNKYRFNEEDLEATRYNLTVEAYVNIAPSDKQQEIFSNYNLGGCSLTVDENSRLYVRLFSSSDGSVDACHTPIPTNTWIHIAATYNSNEVVLYINGNEVDRLSCPGGIGNEYEALEEERYFEIGGRRRTGEDTFLMQKGSKISFVRVYEGAMTDEAVKEAYEKAKQPVTPFEFADVKDTAWFRNSALYAFKNGLMSGTGNNTFEPATNTSRAMIVQMLYNLEGAPEVDTSNNPFTDIPAKKWYTKAVLWAYQNGVTAGTSKTTFSPDTLVTREQVAVFLYRYLKDYKKAEMTEGADLSSFPDEASISKYAGFKEAVAWATAEGIVTGKKNGDTVTLSPLDKAQRSETATMFTRFHRAFVR